MIRASVQALFADPTARTRDMGGQLSSFEMADAILQTIADQAAIGDRQ